MAAVSAPQQLTGKSLLGKLALALKARARRSGRPSGAAEFITDHSGTLAALGLIDTGLWHVNPVAGWIGTGITVLVAELKIRG